MEGGSAKVAVKMWKLSSATLHCTKSSRRYQEVEVEVGGGAPGGGGGGGGGGGVTEG